MMVHYDYLVCPIEYSLRKDDILTAECIRNPVFVLAEYMLPKSIQTFTSVVSSILASRIVEKVSAYEVFVSCREFVPA